MTPIVKMKKLRLREIKQHALGVWGRLRSAVCVIAEHMLFTPTGHCLPEWQP